MTRPEVIFSQVFSPDNASSASTVFPGSSYLYGGDGTLFFYLSLLLMLPMTILSTACVAGKNSSSQPFFFPSLMLTTLVYMC